MACFPKHKQLHLIACLSESTVAAFIHQVGGNMIDTARSADKQFCN